MNFWKIMFSEKSISDNVLIFIAAVVAALFMIFSCIIGRTVSKHFDTENGSVLKKTTYYWLDNLYTVFITIISMFPLMGMLGTVMALINLNSVFEAGVSDITAIQSEFFLALTSTAWGIIFSLIFKFINSFFQPFIENQIEKAKKVLGI